MPKLDDTRRVMLSTAAQRDDRSLYPLPPAIKATTCNQAIAALFAFDLVEERETTIATKVHRTDGDVRYGIFATDTGIAALDGVEEALPPPRASSTIPVLRVTKSSILLDLLRQKDGVTLSELVAATDWLPHTTRAALTGLRKKGHEIERTKRDNSTCYRIAKTA